MSKGINVLSVFDGVSIGKVALDRAGLEVEKYFASEIDLKAMEVSMDNHDDIIYIGDVRMVDPGSLGHIDLVIGGSPCQGFSKAGKMLNFDDPRSKLFFEFVRILGEIRKINPEVLFLLENVKMKREWVDIISEHMGVQPIEIDSKLVSAQNRKRLYWTNIPGVTQPEDRGITLGDILERDIEGVALDEKSEFMHNGKKVVVDPNLAPPYMFVSARTELGKKLRREMRQKTGRDFTSWKPEHRIYQPVKGSKANTLTTVDDPSTFVYDLDHKYRKLTITEMERLQTLPDGYTSSVSKTAARTALGNGWTAEVISHIFSFINLKSQDMETTSVEDKHKPQLEFVDIMRGATSRMTVGNLIRINRYTGTTLRLLCSYEITEEVGENLNHIKLATDGEHWFIVFAATNGLLLTNYKDRYKADSRRPIAKMMDKLGIILKEKESVTINLEEVKGYNDIHKVYRVTLIAKN